jgi:hypothetical protein
VPFVDSKSITKGLRLLLFLKSRFDHHNIIINGVLYCGFGYTIFILDLDLPELNDSMLFGT